MDPPPLSRPAPTTIQKAYDNTSSFIVNFLWFDQTKGSAVFVDALGLGEATTWHGPAVSQIAKELSIHAILPIDLWLRGFIASNVKRMHHPRDTAEELPTQAIHVRTKLVVVKRFSKRVSTSSQADMVLRLKMLLFMNDERLHNALTITKES